MAAEKIEMVMSKSRYVAQPWIYGNSFFPMLVAVVTPDFVELHAAAKVLALPRTRNQNRTRTLTRLCRAARGEGALDVT